MKYPVTTESGHSATLSVSRSTDGAAVVKAFTIFRGLSLPPGGITLRTFRGPLAHRNAQDYCVRVVAAIESKNEGEVTGS